MTATPPKPSLVKSTALSKVQAVTNRINSLLPTVPSALSPVTVYQAGTLGVGSQLTAPTSLFPAGAGYYGTWVAPDLNNGKDYTVQVECFGGGGGGGGGSTTSGGGGGGGAEYAAEKFYPVKPGTTYVYQVGVPGSPGTANAADDQGATAGGNGGDTIFDIAGTGVAGGVVAHGGQGGDAGNTGLGGNGGSGSANTFVWAGGAGGTNLPGGGGGSGGQGGTDNPVSLFAAGLLSATPQAWYIMNDSTSTGSLNDATGRSQVAQPGSYAGGGLSYAQGSAPSQVPAYQLAASPPSSPNATTAGTMLQFDLAQLTAQSGYVLCPGFPFSGTQVTISGWVTPDPSGTWGNTANGSRAVVAANCEGYANASTAGVALYFKQNGTPSNPVWILTFYCSNGSSSQTVSAGVPATPGSPVYVVATFNSGAMTLYVNATSIFTATASFSSIPTWPTVPYGLTLGADPQISRDWFFGYMSNFWFADGVLSGSGVTQAFSGSGGSSTAGGAGGGASGGPEATGGNGAAGSGSSGGAGGTPATQPGADIGINTPASAGIAGAAGGSTNTGLTGAPGAGGGGAGSSASPPAITTVQVPFITAATYCGTDALGSASVAPLTSSITTPPAFSLVSPLLTFTQAGVYTIYWSVSLSGTISGTELNNFAVFQNEDFQVATSVNAAAAGAYPQAAFLVDANAGDTLVVSNPVTGTSGAVYAGTISAVGGGAAGTIYNPVLQGASGKLFTGGLASDTASGSKNSLLILPPNLTAQLAGQTVLRVTLTVTSANPLSTQNTLMQVGWAGDAFLPAVYGAGDMLGSAGVVEIPAGGGTVTADLTESLLGPYLLFGLAQSLVLGPGNDPGFAAYNASTAADFYTAIYGPGAVDNAGNSLAPYLTITYASAAASLQQGSPGGTGGILVTFLNQAQTLVGSWNSTDGINAQGGQLTETSVVLGSASVTDGAALDRVTAKPAFTGFTDEQKATIRAAFAELGAGRLGSGIAGAPGIIAGYTATPTTVTQTTPGSYTFTVPAGVTTLSVACWGAGAGGTGGTSGQGQGGGGGGAYAGEPNYLVSPGDVISYTVGQGGTGDPVGSNNSPDGGLSAFDTTLVAGRGVTANGGQHYQGNLNYGPGGATAGNTVAFSGGKGGPLSGGQSNGSGGGGSAGASGNGGNGNQGGTRGSAGSGGGANGGSGGNANANGNNGSVPGGGGGGAGKGSSSHSGGSGGNGKVAITYLASTNLVTSIATAAGTDGAGNPFPAGVVTNFSQVNGNHVVSGQVLVGGASTLAALGVAGSGHLSGDLGVDGDLIVGGNVSAGSINGGQVVVGGQSTLGFPLGGSTSVGTVSGTNVVIAGGFQLALNSLYNALVNSGLV